MVRCGAPIPKLGVLFSVQYICEERKIKTPFKDGLPGLFLKCTGNKHDNYFFLSVIFSYVEGERWFNNFIARHDELTYKKKNISAKRERRLQRHV